MSTIINKLNIDNNEYETHNIIEYSTNAIDTGCKWIDGRTIWRKVIKAQFGDYNSKIWFRRWNVLPRKNAYNNQYERLYMIGSYRNNDALNNKNTVFIRCSNESFEKQSIIIILEYTRI